MIAYCRNYIKDRLQALEIVPVYLHQDDADQHTGNIFSYVSVGVEKLTKAFIRVAKEDDSENKIRRYRYKIYDSMVPLYVMIVAKDLDQAEVFRQNFLQTLDTRFLDPDGNAISLEAIECETVQEFNSIQDPREGYQITIQFTGGVYKDQSIDLITGEQMTPEPEVVK